MFNEQKELGVVYSELLVLAADADLPASKKTDVERVIRKLLPILFPELRPRTEPLTTFGKETARILWAGLKKKGPTGES